MIFYKQVTFQKVLGFVFRKEIISTSLNLFWKFFSGPFLLIFIPQFLSDVHQGYWFTFGSLSALVLLFDAGFSRILIIFAGHQFSNLSFDKFNFIVGDNNDINKLSLLLKYTVKWAIKNAIIMLPIFIVIGSLFFYFDNSIVEWFLPWIIFSLSVSFRFILNIFLNFYEGINQIHKTQLNIFSTSVITTLITITLLLFRFNLYALALSNILSVLIGFVLFFFKFLSKF